MLYPVAKILDCYLVGIVCFVEGSVADLLGCLSIGGAIHHNELVFEHAHEWPVQGWVS